MTRVLFVLAALAFLFPVTAAQAQAKKPASVAAVPAPVSAAPAEEAKDGEYPARLELAKKMHEIRPTSQQVEFAIDQAANANIPEADRAAFKERLMKSIDMPKLEQASEEAMAEVFSLAELQKMIDYYSTPEAKSAAEKMPLYQNMVQPEIVKMLDSALISLRTGAPVATPVPQKAK